MKPTNVYDIGHGQVGTTLKKQRTMDEIWTKWEPIPDLKEKYYVEYIQDDPEIFKVRLYESYASQKRLDIVFENLVKSYRRTDETLRYRVVCYLEKRYDTNFYAKGTFFKITNSKYLEWLSQESCSISDHIPLIHFVLLAADSLVDIVAGYEPIVSSCKKNRPYA